MSHIDYQEQLSPNAVTPDEWLGPSARLRTLVNKLAERSDLSVTVGPGVGLGNPACFLPWRAELRIDTSICLADTSPDSINPHDALWKLEHPVFMGATGHESGHAAHTRWAMEDFTSTGKVTPKHLDVIMLLEEPRCEARLMTHARGQKLFLRAAALDLILADFTIPKTPYGAAAACALILARIDGGTLEKQDGNAVRDMVSTVLSGSTIAQLETLWREFLVLGDRNFPSMYSVARRWLEVLEEDSTSTEGLVMNLQAEGEGEPKGEGEAEIEGWLREAIGGAAVRADGQIVSARSEERGRRQMAADEADSERREASSRAASDAFKPLDDDGNPPYSAHRTGERPPTKEEQQAATELSQRLMVAEERENPDIGRATRQKPPGRLRSREASQAAAYKELGLRSRPEMFRSRSMVKEARDPLSIALMLDISGSMERAEAAISSTHWVVSHAGHRVGARVTAVHFGAVVHGVARVGQLHENVQLYDCSDPWEEFKKGFLAADHEIQLLDGHGPRLLVIASDGQYRKEIQQKFAEAAMTLCRQKGVGVIWLQLTRKFLTNYGYGTVLDMEGAAPVEIAVAVGNAAIAQMERSR